MKPTTELALVLISRRQGACPTSFLHHGVGSRYGARIGELRDMGYEIEKRRCEQHDHPDRVAWAYHLSAKPTEEPGQLELEEAS